MSITEGLLIVIVIVLVYMMTKMKKEKESDTVWHTITGRPGDQVASDNVQLAKPMLSPEQASIRENAEYFAGGSDPADAGKKLGTVCSDTDDHFAYAVSDFGAPGKDFKDWVTEQAVDAATYKNHAEFTKDRFGSDTQNLTGRTYSPDSHDSYNFQPWVGLGRPQAVPVNNPDQVSDTNDASFSTKSRFMWSSK